MKILSGQEGGKSEPAWGSVFSASDNLRILNVSDTLGHKLFDKESMAPVELWAGDHIIEDCKLAIEIHSRLQCVKHSQSFSWQTSRWMNDLPGCDIVEKRTFSQQDELCPARGKPHSCSVALGGYGKAGCWYKQRLTDTWIREWSDKMQYAGIGSLLFIKPLLFHTVCRLLPATQWVSSNQEGGGRCFVYSSLYLIDIYWKLLVPSIIRDFRDNTMEKRRSPISWRLLSTFEFFLIFEYFYFSMSNGRGMA